MGSELARPSGGLGREDREAARQARAAGAEARLIAYKVSLLEELTGFAMEKAIDVDDIRRRPADGDQTKNLLLAEFEETFVQKAKRLQRGTFDELGMS